VTLFWKRKQAIRVLVATRNPEVSRVLAAAANDGGKRLRKRSRVHVTEALSTQGAYDALPGCDLAVVDVADLVVSPTFPVATLAGALQQSELPVAGGDAFAAEPQAWLEQAIAATGLLAALPPRVVAFTGYSGGVGKTTLSLNLARYVAGRLRLPAAIVELNFGRSALAALTTAELPDFHEVLTQGAAPGTWQGITVLPMNYVSARLLLSREEEIDRLLEDMARRHVLTIVDAAAANPFFPRFHARAQMTLVVADPRPDAVINAQALAGELVVDDDVKDERRSEGGADIVLNKMNGLSDRLALGGLEAAVRLPYVSRPDQDRRLSEPLLQVVYPGWRAT
jgi:MinD-like ATPase involved in chromosome partitioning or flagellar assembly